MNVWRDAWWLVRFEAKHSWKHYLFAVPFVLILAFVIIRPILPEYFENATMGIDFFFGFGFVLMSQFFRPKQFRSQKMSGIHYAVPFLITISQQPVSKRTIILYRFLMYFLLSGGINLLLLICLYPFFQSYMDATGYLAFAIIWLSFGVYIGCANPATEVTNNLVWSIVIGLFGGFFLFVLYIRAFYSWYESGLVNWTIDLAQHHPLASISISIILAGIAIFAWIKVMRYKLDKAEFMA